MFSSSPANDNTRENDAHTAHTSNHVDGEGLVVGSIKIHTVPKAAMRELGFGLHLDSVGYVLAGRGTVSV